MFSQASRIALALFVSWLSSAQAAAFTGPVVSVLDSDTIEVLHNTHPERIRLSGINCPENGQAYGKRAKQAASAMILGEMSSSRPTARTSTGEPWQTCSYPMEPMSITHWSRTSGARGIGGMLQEIQKN
jgi:endonuclease YncB( thermonuclease family)